MIRGLALLAGNSKPVKQTKSNGYQMLRHQVKWIGVYLTKIETIGKCLFEMPLNQFVDLFIYLFFFLRVPCESLTKS